MRRWIMATMAAGALFAQMAAADAMPLGNPGVATGADVTLVAQGCGPGFFRGPMGHCRMMGGRGMYRPGPRFCPPGMHRGRFGGCRVF